MTRKPGDSDSTVEHELVSGGLHLLVVGAERFATHSVPASGAILLGRSEQCDVQIDDASISRRHAELTLSPELAIKDLDSANGTMCGERRLVANQPCRVRLGEPIQLGTVTVILQRRLPSARPRRIWDHGYFEGRVEEECGRAERTRSGFALLFIRVTDARTTTQVEEQLAVWFRAADVIGSYGPTEYEVLLVDVSPADAQVVADKLRTVLGERDIGFGLGLVCYPKDGRDAHTLLATVAVRARGKPLPERDLPVVVEDPAMHELYRLADIVSKSEIAVILLGETGTGKEVLAEAIHRGSPRARGPFLRINCAALTETLLESELFGHERGAFTGATSAKRGLLETAKSGTVLLDEIGELPLSTQAKLLRVIEHHEVLPVGAVKHRPIDVRFLAATNRDLEHEVVRGTFRRDLFFRLNGFSLVIPPLRERPLDIEALARGFVDSAASRSGRRRVPKLSAECLDALRRYSWPGNVRELRNAIDRAVLLCTRDVLEPAHLPLEKMRQTLSAHDGAHAREPRSVVPRTPVARATETTGEIKLADLGPKELRKMATEAERRKIVEALAQHAGNQTRAAAVLGIARRTLVKKLAQHGIARPRKR